MTRFITAIEVIQPGQFREQLRQPRDSCPERWFPREEVLSHGQAATMRGPEDEFPTCAPQAFFARTR